jgi:hypothetical protein
MVTALVGLLTSVSRGNSSSHIPFGHMSGLSLFQRAEGCYAQGKVQEAFDLYQKSVKKILKDENVAAKLPAIVPDDFPQETLAAVWRNFVGFFRDPNMSFTKKSDSDAYRLLYSFRPSAANPHPRMEMTPRGKVLQKAMQITAGMTLGLMAWDERDRATAAKRYKEALDLAATHPPFTTLSSSTVGLERWVYLDLQETKDNLDIILQNDSFHAHIVGSGTDGRAPGRRDVVDLPLPLNRIDKTGGVTTETSVMFATNACAKCGKRDVKLMRCSLCKKMPCECAWNFKLMLFAFNPAVYLDCGTECQRADWKCVVTNATLFCF